jgi:hypothetical protein
MAIPAGSAFPHAERDAYLQASPSKDEVRTIFINRVSWGAVMAGVMVALVVQLILNMLGIGLGAASFDPIANNSPSATTFSLMADVWSLARASDPFGSIEQSIRDTSGGSEPATLRDAALSAMRAALTGEINKADEARERAAQAISKAQGIAIEQARAQVAQYEQQYRQTVDQAKRQAAAAADATASAIARGALVGAFALIFSALAGWVGGRMGTLDPADLARNLRGRRSTNGTS